MHWVFSAVRIFPFWAFPIALVLAELGMFFRRRKNSAQFFVFGMAAILLFLTILWVIGRGDLNSDKWVKQLFP